MNIKTFKSVWLFLWLLFSSSVGFAQIKLYTFNNGDRQSKNKVDSLLEDTKTKLPADYDLKVLIYHKETNKDTLLNYITLTAIPKDSSSTLATPEYTYQQDSVFLLLNKKLPQFKLKSLQGRNYSSRSFLGKPMLITFWATYCKPCIQEMPALSKLKNSFKGQINFISITENDGKKDHLLAFLKDKKFNFLVLENGEALKRLLKIRAIPKNLFIDKYGVIKFIQGNYPVGMDGLNMSVGDKNNYFVNIINWACQSELIDKIEIHYNVQAILP